MWYPCDDVSTEKKQGRWIQNWKSSNQTPLELAYPTINKHLFFGLEQKGRNKQKKKMDAAIYFCCCLRLGFKNLKRTIVKNKIPVPCFFYFGCGSKLGQRPRTLWAKFSYWVFCCYCLCTKRNGPRK